jgi:hypothetical protein
LKEAEHLIKTVRSVGYMLSEKKNQKSMNPKLLFWVPALLRTAIILAACAVAGGCSAGKPAWCWRCWR